MTEILHGVIHALSEIQKIDDEQAALHAKRKTLMDKIGKWLTEMVNNGKD